MEDTLTLEFYKSQYRRVAKYILGNSGTEEEAEDAYNEAWKSILLRHKSGAVIGDYSRYLFKTAVNAYRRECKRKGKELPTDPSDFERDLWEDEEELAPQNFTAGFGLQAEAAPDDLPAPSGAASAEDDENELLQVDNWGIVGQALLLLPKLHQEIIYLALVLEYNNAMIAGQIGGYTENSMAVEKTRAFKALRRHTAQLLHLEGNSYYLKLERRKEDAKSRAQKH